MHINKELYKKAKYDALTAQKANILLWKALRKYWQTKRITEHPELSWHAQENGSNW